MDHKNNITNLINYFINQVELINKLTAPDVYEYDLIMNKEALFVSILDSLSSYRFNKKNYPELYKQNKNRFTRFLIEFAEWEEGSLVSIPFLIKYLPNSQSNNPLYNYLETINLTQFTNGDSYLGSKIDIELKELLKLCNNEIEEKALYHNQHFAIIYRYRNYLIHEARIPGKSMQLMDYEDNRIRYHGYAKDENSDLYLLYPIRLFQELVESSLNNFKSYFIEKNINPYEHLKDTSVF